MKTELKPCPFCGSEAEVNHGTTYGFRYEYEPRCTKCECMLGVYETEKEAIETWNRRAKESKNIATESIEHIVKCTDCKYADESVHSNSVWCAEHNKTMMESDFCSYGIKKTEEV